MAILTGDKKPGEVQLPLVTDAVPETTEVPFTGEVRPVEGEEVPYGESGMGS